MLNKPRIVAISIQICVHLYIQSNRFIIARSAPEQRQRVCCLLANERSVVPRHEAASHKPQPLLKPSNNAQITLCDETDACASKSKLGCAKSTGSAIDAETKRRLQDALASALVTQVLGQANTTPFNLLENGYQGSNFDPHSAIGCIGAY